MTPDLLPSSFSDSNGDVTWHGLMMRSLEVGSATMRVAPSTSPCIMHRISCGGIVTMCVLARHREACNEKLEGPAWRQSDWTCAFQKLDVQPVRLTVGAVNLCCCLRISESLQVSPLVAVDEVICLKDGCGLDDVPGEQDVWTPCTVLQNVAGLGSCLQFFRFPDRLAFRTHV